MGTIFIGLPEIQTCLHPGEPVKIKPCASGLWSAPRSSTGQADHTFYSDPSGDYPDATAIKPMPTCGPLARQSLVRIEPFPTVTIFEYKNYLSLRFQVVRTLPPRILLSTERHRGF